MSIDRDRDARSGTGEARTEERRSLPPGKRTLVEARSLPPDHPVGPGKRTLAEALPPQRGGMPLPSSVRSPFERSLGTDLRDVRVHTDADANEQASAVGARAFATGNSIVFASGEYQPGSASGRRLLAEEVAHTVQQRGAKPNGPLATTTPGDPVERQATDAAASMIAGMRARVTPQPMAIARSVPAPAGGVTPPPPPNMQHPPGYKPEPEEKGAAKPGTEIGTWDDTTKIMIASFIGFFNNEAEAMAVAHSSGAVILETGRYAAYKIMTNAWFEDFTYENCKVLKGTSQYTSVWINAAWLAVTTSDGVVLRPSQYNMPAAKRQLTPELMLKPGESPFAGFRERLGDGAKQQLGNEELIAAFSAAMKKAAYDVLNTSEKEVEKKKDQFRDKKGTTSGEFKLIRDTAQKLVDKDAEILKAADEESTANMSIDPKSSDAAALRAQRDAARRRKEQHKADRKQIEQEYPMLARQDAKKILGSTDEQIAKMLGDDTLEIIRDIATARDDMLTGELDLWGVNSMVETTIAGCGIKDPQRRKVITDHAADVASGKAIKKGILTAFSIGLGLIAAFSTGGLAVVAAAGALGLSTYDAMEATREYAIDKSAANTDLNPELALAAKDISGEWKWVFLAWVGVGLDIHSVASAVKGIKSAGDILKAGEQLAKGSEDLLKKLKIAVNLVGDEVISETTRSVVAMKLGAALEVKPGLGTKVHVLFEVDDVSGRLIVKGVRAGAEATIKDILAHADTVKLLTRYDGVAGKLREIVERMFSIVPEEVSDLEQIAAKLGKDSQAYTSYLEVKKLKGIVKQRTNQLKYAGREMTAEMREALERDISYFEDEIRRHQDCVDRLAAEKSEGFIAKGEHVTAEAIDPKKGKMPDFRKHPGVPPEHYQYYYYRRDGAGYELCTRQDAPAGVKRLALGPNKEIVEGAPGAVQKGKMLVASWNADQQAAFEALEQLGQKQGAYRVVPLQGIKKTGLKVGDAFSATQRAQMVDIYKKAWMAKGLSEADAGKRAMQTVKKVMDHDITLIQGTEQLRLFDYAKKYPGKPIGELHHDIPLYLGGDHTILTDVGKLNGVDLHDELHKVIDGAKFKDGGTLAPHDLAAKIPTTPGAAVLGTGGEIEFYKMTGSGAATKFEKIN
jgi:hypothetical protein